MINRLSNIKFGFAFYYIVVLILSADPLFASNESRIDSLEKQIKFSNDVQRIEIFNKLSQLYLTESDIRSYYYADTAYKIAIREKSVKGIITSLNNLATVSKNLGKYPDAYIFSMRALQYSQAFNEKYETARALDNLGDVFFYQKNTSEAVMWYNQAYTIYSQLNYKEGIIDMLLSLGDIYLKRLNKTKALDNFNQALGMAESLKDSNRIAQAYLRLGNWYSKDFKLQVSLDYYGKAENIYGLINNNRGLVNCYEYTGLAYSDNGNFKKSIVFHKKSFEFASLLGDKNLVLSSYNNLFTAYYGMSDYKEALNYYLLYTALNDSIITESRQQIFRMQFKYEKENSLNEIKVLEKQKELSDLQLKQNRTYIHGFLFSSFILLVFLVVIIYAYYQKRKSNRILNNQKDLIIWEKMQSETLLLNILPYDIAEELKNRGKATVRHYDMVSVMFADFKGFSKITELIPPEILIAELDKHFAKMDEIIGKYNLEKIKTIGDCYMCVGGIPNPNKTNAIEAVLAGMEFQRYMKEYSILKTENKETLWELRIGIHTGKVIAGVVGKKKFAYDIWGETVNTASRMESGGEEGRVNISGTTYEEVKEYFDCTFRGKMDVKNQIEMDMYFVDNIKPFYSQYRKGILPNANLKKLITLNPKLDIDIV
jgi:adenylate cyclase